MNYKLNLTGRCRRCGRNSGPSVFCSPGCLRKAEEAALMAEAGFIEESPGKFTRRPV